MKKYHRVGLSALISVAVLLIPSLLSCVESQNSLVKPKSITEVIFEHPQFSILKDIIESTNMADSLKADPITLFAPSNEAFEKANIISSAAILSLPLDSAKSFLQNHILMRKIQYSRFVTGQLKAHGGANLTITKVGTDITVNRSAIILPNINARNGVVHVIDSLLVKYR